MYINLHNLLTQTIIPRQLIFVHFPILASYPTLFLTHILPLSINQSPKILNELFPCSQNLIENYAFNSLDLTSIRLSV
jgi:hypothetical protein